MNINKNSLDDCLVVGLFRSIFFNIYVYFMLEKKEKRTGKYGKLCN